MSIDILNNERFTNIAPITKGWSKDKKYCVTDKSGTRYLLRISDISRYENRELLFEMQRRVATLRVPMCKPIEFGTCVDGVYSLQSWIDGEDLKTVLLQYSEAEQYALGVQSGEILKAMHSIPTPEGQEDWAAYYNRKIDRALQAYQDCGIRFAGDAYVMEYIAGNRGFLENRPQYFQHGDYHIGNMMLENGKLVIIDFDRYSFGDPWEEFNRVVFSAAVSSHFATGQLRGYFIGEPPLEFFRLLTLYIAVNALASMPWAIQFGQDEVDFMLKQSQTILAWHDNMINPVPTWYFKGFA